MRSSRNLELARTNMADNKRSEVTCFKKITSCSFGKFLHAAGKELIKEEYLIRKVIR